MNPLPRLQVRDSCIHGKGLFAGEDIPAGAYIGFYEGTPTLENDTHVLWVEQDSGGLFEDGRHWMGYDGTGDLRYLNHEVPPNCEMDGQALYALRDVEAGEELTIDYGEWFEGD